MTGLCWQIWCPQGGCSISGGDFVRDTVPEAKAARGCPTFLRTCTGSSIRKAFVRPLARPAPPPPRRVAPCSTPLCPPPPPPRARARGVCHGGVGRECHGDVTLRLLICTLLCAAADFLLHTRAVPLSQGNNYQDPYNNFM